MEQRCLVIAHNAKYKNSNDMKEKIEKLLLFETELNEKACKRLAEELWCLYNVSHCSKGKLAEEFQKGYKEGYEDGANAAANDIAANPHKMY